MIELFALECTVPCSERRVEQPDSSDYVRDSELGGIVEGPVDVRFGGEVYYTVDLIALKYLREELHIEDIAFFKMVIGMLLQVAQVLEIAGVRKLVEIDDSIRWVTSDKPSDDVRSDESGSAGDQYSSSWGIVT